MRHPKSPKASPARAEAWRLMNGVVVGQELISDLTAMDQHRALAPADRAASLRLALQGLRFADRSDWAMKPFLAHAPHPSVRNLIRLGVAEVNTSSAAAHGVVNDMVNLARSTQRTAGHKGMVNAVLRKALEKVEGNWGKAPVPKMAKWLRGPLAEAYGNKNIQAIEAAQIKTPPVDISVKSDPVGWAEKLDGTVLPNGTIRTPAGRQVSALPGFEDGDWWVQDAAAAMAVQLSPVEAGAKVLDLCAAPGGKALQFAALGADVTAVDLSDHRLDRLRQNLDRTGLSAQIVVEDALKFKSGQYDVVLLDAPCSATGTMRRHPDLGFARDGAEIGGLIALQKKLLKHAATLVKPGGRLIFCTCSLLPDEGEVQVEDFLGKAKGFKVIPPTHDWIDPDWVTEEGGLRLRPDFWSDQGGMDGFYIAHLQRDCNKPSRDKSTGQCIT